MIFCFRHIPFRGIYICSNQNVILPSVFIYLASWLHSPIFILLMIAALEVVFSINVQIDVIGLFALGNGNIEGFLSILIFGLRLKIRVFLRKAEMKVGASKVLNYIFLNNLSFGRFVGGKSLLTFRCISDFIRSKVNVGRVGLLMDKRVRSLWNAFVDDCVLRFKGCLIVPKH